ncbi:MAG: translation elongation factor Ts [Actinomycetota bacterium]|nr:translation elongation factor Ts [Actinomycetota bacterium]
MTVSAAQVKQLREMTGAGMMDCKEALGATGGDTEKALDYLRKKGASVLSKKSSRAANEGMIKSYIHPGSRLGVMVEVNCETDFVARNEDFQNFSHDVAMHIAAAAPLWVSRDQVPKEVIEREGAIFKEQALAEGKPEKIVDRIIEGKMDKFFEANCLMEQPFVKNPDINIAEYLSEMVAKIGENIVIRRFVRFALGEDL